MLKVLLIVVQGKPEGKTIPISVPVFRVGRGEDCHLRPNSEEVSRRHAEITIGETEVTVRDLGSRNGTRVNGKLLTGSHTLRSGELLQIGPLTFAVAIQGAPAAPQRPAEPQPAAAGAKAGPALDDVPHDEIEAWLVSDNARPTPDRPSGVYDGETLTIDAYREGAAAKPKSSGSVAQPKSTASMPVTPPPPPAAEADDEPESPFEAAIEGIEQLPEGTGDAPPPALDDEAVGEGEGEGEGEEADELIDESNPFYAAKKAAAAGVSDAAAKAAYKDTSDAASDILRRMLERRRGGRP